MTIVSGTIQAVSTLPGAGLAPTSTVNMVALDTATSGITATPSGTQATSILLTSRINNVTVVATAGDAVRLPPAIAGMVVKVRNGTATAMGVFPASAAQGGAAGGDQINALAQNAVYSEAANGTITFTCYATGVWLTV